VVALFERFAPARLGRGYRWLVSSSWIGSIGDGIALSAGPLLVASETHSAFLVAAAALLQRLPWLVFGLHAGVIADRVDRRVLLLTSETLRAIVIGVLCLCIFIGTVDIAIVLIAMFLMGTAEVFSNTTSTTLLPMLVAKDDLGLANSRIFGSYVVGEQLLGPPLGAFLFAAGREFPFLVQTLVVTLAMLLVARIGTARGGVGEPKQGGVTAEIKEGVRWLTGHPPIRTLALTILSFNITWGAAWAVLVLYALHRLHIGEVGYGLLTTASGIGGGLAIVGYGWLERRWSLSAIMRVCLTLEVLMHLTLAINKTGWIAMLVMFIFGAYSFVWGTVSQTVRQRAVPQELQGRVGSVYLMCMFGGIVIGQLLGGVIAEQWGIDAPFWFAFAGSGLTLLLVWRELGVIAHAGD
jgi:predicted MFS family arabinose efflux permease